MADDPRTVPTDWVRSDIPNEGAYAHMNRDGDLCFYSRAGRCDTRIPASLLPSFREWLASVPSDAACVEPGGCVTSDGCEGTGGCVMAGRST